MPVPIPPQQGTRWERASIRTLKKAVRNARLGREEGLGALKRLDRQARQLEVWAKAPSFEAVLAKERQASAAYGGGGVLGKGGWSLAEKQGTIKPIGGNFWGGVGSEGLFSSAQRTLRVN